MGNVPQRQPRTPRKSELTKEEAKLQQKRTEIVKEIASTERSYVNALLELHNNWERPLREAVKAGKPIISEGDINSIFNIAEGILCLHQNLLKSLEERLSKWDHNTYIADIFIRNGTALKLYREYVNNYNNSMIVLNRVIQSVPQFLEFSKGRCKGNPHHILNSLLIQPIQRIPRYEMLLKDLEKSTWITHDDMEMIQIALAKIVEAASFINEEKRRVEFLERFITIENEVGEDLGLMSGGRSIVQEGIVKVVVKKVKGSDKKEKGKEKEVGYCLMSDKLLVWKHGTVFLFSDLEDILIAAEDPTTLNLKSPSEVIGISFKHKEESERFQACFNNTKKERKENKNKIERAIFIVPTDAVSEKIPLIEEKRDTHQGQQQGCCCVVL